jgi:hypothetical protein
MFPGLEVSRVRSHTTGYGHSERIISWSALWWIVYIELVVVEGVGEVVRWMKVEALPFSFQSITKLWKLKIITKQYEYYRKDSPSLFPPCFY